MIEVYPCFPSNEGMSCNGAIEMEVGAVSSLRSECKDISTSFFSDNRVMSVGVGESVGIVVVVDFVID